MGTDEFEVILASRNVGKISEFGDLLKATGWVVKGAEGAAPLEDGGSYAANARIKAEGGLAESGRLWVLADDSGLEVAVLGGMPGVETAHFGGWEKLLEVMREVPEGRRNARFICVLALARPGRDTLFFEGVHEGRIAQKPAGHEGFGYDPVFVPQGFEITFAEMDKAQKSAISHRAKAVEALLAWWEREGKYDV